MKECYGKIYPPVENNTSKRDFNGKVFSVHITSLGTWGQKKANWEYNLDEWQVCQHCEQFKNCYDLSNAKAIMHLLLQLY